MNRRLVLHAMMSREWKALFRDRQHVIGLAVFAASMLFLAFILESGPPIPAFRNAPRLTLLGLAGFLSMFVSFIAVPLGLGAFVGEKEERTLELLLAAPVPDRTLYVLRCLGIILPMAAIGYLFLLAGLLYLLLFHGSYAAQLPPGLLTQVVLLSLPLPLLTTAMQVGLAGSISIWADTRKGADQLFGAVMTLLVFGGALIGFLTARSSLREPMAEATIWWLHQGFAFQYLSLVGMLAAGGAAVLGLGAVFFHRERLVA